MQIYIERKYNTRYQGIGGGGGWSVEFGVLLFNGSEILFEKMKSF